MNECRRRMIRRVAATLACSLGVLLVVTGCGSGRDGQDLKTLGLEYRLQKLNDPRPNHVHVLRVDLADGRIRPAVVIAADPDGDSPAEAALTDPFKLASDPSILAFVNTNPWDSLPDTAGMRDRNWFEGQPVDIRGQAVSGGHVRSPAEPGGPSVGIDAQGRVFLGDVPGDGSVSEGMAGFQQIVREGTVVVSPGGPLHPRTAIGADRTAKILWLVVVDGRQAQYSEGMTLQELGDVMRELGCWNAMNMDGGGSSIMGLAGADGLLRVVNSPSDRRSEVPRIRPLPMILTIRQTAGSRLSAARNEAATKQPDREQDDPTDADESRRWRHR